MCFLEIQIKKEMIVMRNVLFVNACVRSNSRTLRLANEVLSRLSGNIEEINLEKENISPLNQGILYKRNIF